MNKARGKDPLWSVFESGDRPAPSPIPQSVPETERPARPFLVQDPAYWEEDFGRWAIECCLLRDGCWWSVKSLHEDFCDWCLGQDTVGCMAETFAALLKLEGLSMGSNTAEGMTYGLVLKAEYLSLSTQKPPAKEVPTWNAKRR